MSKRHDEAEKLVGFEIKIGGYTYTVKKIRWDIDEIEATWVDKEGKSQDTFLSMSLLPWLLTKAKDWLKSKGDTVTYPVGETLEGPRPPDLH